MKIETKHKRILIAGLVLLLIGVGFLVHDDEPSFLEVERLKAFERHSEISEGGRQTFDARYQRLPPESKTPEAIARALELEEPLKLEPRPDGGHEAHINVEGRYAQLTLKWDAQGQPEGYTWEIQSHAVDSATWAKHLESFSVNE